MKKSTIVTIILIAAAVVLGVIFISWYLRKATPLYIQGTVECTTYKASSKVPGRIEEMKVEEGQHVTKGELLYTLSTPELNAKLQQAEAVKSAASAMDQKALTGARIQQKEAALNLWEKAQAGLLLAQKTFDRVNNLYEQGVVPAQKLDEARANLQAMQATERAAKAQCELVFDGASKEEKEAAAAQVRQAEGAVSEVESYLSDALVYAPVTGEVSTIIAEAGELVGTGYPVVAGKAFVYASIYAVTLFYILGLHYKLFHFPTNGHTADIIAFLIPYLLSCIFLGIAVSTLFQRREQSIMLLLWCSIPALMLSGASVPREAMPEWLYRFGQILPSSSGVEGFIRLQSMGASFSDVLHEVRILWILTIVYGGFAAVGIHLRLKQAAGK